MTNVILAEQGRHFKLNWAVSVLKPEHLRVIIVEIARATVAEGCFEPDKATFQEYQG
jgi:hypothetical protein